MADISLLPEDIRGREEQIKQKPPTSSSSDEGSFKMHVPDAMVDEDIEIIEVDEGDLAAVLSDEPFMTRMTYKLSLWVDQIKGKFLKHEEEAPPAKAPPQFFKPPKKGLITSSNAVMQSVDASKAGLTSSLGVGGSAGAGPAGAGEHRASRTRITPQTEVPRRVRIIKRVRKPVRVSLISAEDLAVLTIDVGRRKWTLVVFIILFSSLIAGGFFLISSRLNISKSRLATVQDEVSKIKKEADDKMGQWKQYEDLEGRIKLLQTVLDGHVFITRLFDFLEQNTLRGVSYKTASWSGSGQLNLDVVASTFDDTGGQLIVMNRSPFVENAESSGFEAQRNEETGAVEQIGFQMVIMLKPDIFKGIGLESESFASSTNESTSMMNP